MRRSRRGPRRGSGKSQSPLPPRLSFRCTLARYGQHRRQVVHRPRVAVVLAVRGVVGDLDARVADPLEQRQRERAGGHDVAVDLQRDVDAGVLGGGGERPMPARNADSFSSCEEWPPIAVFMTGTPLRAAQPTAFSAYSTPSSVVRSECADSTVGSSP